MLQSYKRRGRLISMLLTHPQDTVFVPQSQDHSAFKDNNNTSDTNGLIGALQAPSCSFLVLAVPRSTSGQSGDTSLAL